MELVEGEIRDGSSRKGERREEEKSGREERRMSGRRRSKTMMMIKRKGCERGKIVGRKKLWWLRKIWERSKIYWGEYKEEGGREGGGGVEELGREERKWKIYIKN